MYTVINAGFVEQSLGADNQPSHNLSFYNNTFWSRWKRCIHSPSTSGILLWILATCPYIILSSLSKNNGCAF